MWMTKMKIGVMLFMSVGLIAAGVGWANLPAPAPRADQSGQAEEATSLVQESVRPETAAVPGAAMGFARIAVKELWNSEIIKKLREQKNNALIEAMQSAEKAMGASIEEIDSVTLISFAPPESRSELGLLGLIATSAPCNREKIAKALVPAGKELEYGGKKLLVPEGNQGPAVHFISDRLFLVAGQPMMQKYIDRISEKTAGSRLEAGLKLANKNHHLVAAFQMPEQLAAAIKQEELPPNARFMKPLLETKSATLVMDLGKEGKLEATLSFPDGAKSDSAAEAVQAGIGVIKQQIAGTSTEMLRNDPVAGALLKEVEAGLRSVKIVQDKSDVIVTMKLSGETLLGQTFPAVQKAREAASKMNSQNNLKQIALAMHNYHSIYNRFPPAAIADKNGKALLSWRVAILPYIEEHELYKQFKLDEPWDSETNKKLLPKMSRIFLPPNAAHGSTTSTAYRVFTGKSAAFEDPAGPKLQDFSDGTSNTIIVVEAGETVPWTKPDDLEYDAAKPLPKFGGYFKGGFNAAFADGSVRFLSETVSEKNLRALITRNGGELIDR